MTDQNYLRSHGIKCAANGWPVVLLRHGDKAPSNYKWTKTTFTAKQLQQFADKGKRFGIGIRCGNIVALDDDYEEGGAVTTDFLENIRELKDHFFPNSLMRRGRPSRAPLRVFMLTDGASIRSMNIGKFQILAEGRQFVAFNIHPDTGKPYSWLEKTALGSPFTIKLRDVPEYTKKHVENFIRAVQLLEDAYGLAPETASQVLERIKGGDYKPGELAGDQDLVTRACEYLENKPEYGWEEWNRNVMMPLWGASSGHEWGRELAHKVSEPHAMYDKDATDERWDALTRSPPTRIGAGTVYWQARQNGMPFMGPRDWDDYKVFLDREEVLNERTNNWLKKTIFNDFFNPQKEKGTTPIQTFMVSRPMQMFDTVVWDPAVPYGDAQIGPKRVWNTCKLPDTFGEEGDVTPWLDLMHNLYGDNFEITVKRMAFDVQYPHLKPQWHELIISDHGFGKNLNKTPLRNWFAELAQTMNADKLESQFTSFMSKKKHLEIIELSSVSSRTFNKHKDLLATADPWYDVNEKFMRPYRVKNVVSVWLSANDVDALSLSPTERRLYVTHKRDKSLSQRKLHQIFEWTRDGGWKYVVHYLKHQVEVSASFGDVLPERTEAMMQLVQTAGRAHDKLRVQVRDVTKRCVVFALPELHQHFVEAGICERPGVLVNIETLRKTLISEGAVRCASGMPIRLAEGEQKRLWSFRSDMAGATAAEIRGQWLASENFSALITD